jgi:hypothetical protein
MDFFLFQRESQSWRTTHCPRAGPRRRRGSDEPPAKTSLPPLFEPLQKVYPNRLGLGPKKSWNTRVLKMICIEVISPSAFDFNHTSYIFLTGRNIKTFSITQFDLSMGLQNCRVRVENVSKKGKSMLVQNEFFRYTDYFKKQLFMFFGLHCSLVLFAVWISWFYQKLNLQPKTLTDPDHFSPLVQDVESKTV